MTAIGNVVWFICGGFVLGLAWWLVGLLALLSVVGIPWVKACFLIGSFTFFPFGKEAISRREMTGIDDLGTGSLGTLGNVIWFIFAGLWLALGHLSAALINFCTLIGIPFGIQHLKLAGLSLAPIGMMIVTKEEARAARQHNAQVHVAALRAGTPG